MPKFKSAVIKFVDCPQCGEQYGIRLGPDERHRTGVGICSASTNKAFVRGDSGRIWCGASLAYEIARGYTHVGLVEWSEQPNRFRRVTDEQA